MGAGGLLGNITSKSKSKFSVTAIAVRNVDLLYLKADIFHNIIKVRNQQRECMSK